MSRHIASLLGAALLVIILSACAPETPTPTSAIHTPTATAPPSPTATSTHESEAPAPGWCELVANRETTAYERPSLDARVFATLSPGLPVIAEAITADGWIGFDPGMAQAGNVGVFRLRWVPESDALSLEGACDDLPVVEGPPAGVCFTMAMLDTPVFTEPELSSTVVVTMHVGDYAEVLGTVGDWLNLDLSVGSLNLARRGWIARGMANFNGPCEGLLPAAVTHPPAEPVPDKWDLWGGGTHLRGADLHPCRIFDGDQCHQAITRQDVQDLRNLGANLINASYAGVFTEQEPYEANPTALAYLDDLIGWAEEAGIFVVIHFRTGPGRNEAAIHLADGARFDVWTDQAAHDAWIDMWRFTAERYRDSPVVVGYNLMVEPHVNTLIDAGGELGPTAVQAQIEGTLMDWNAFAAAITAAIREVDSSTPIVVSSLNWADPAWFAALEPTGDPRTVYSLHNYSPDAYTNQEPGETWITYPDVVEDGGETITFDRTWQEDNLRPVLEFAERHDVPIYVGEFGVFRWVPGAVEFLRDQTGLFERYGWHYSVYVWRGDELYFDGFNLEYGKDPDNHVPVPENPLLGVFIARWAQNVHFPADALPR